MTKLYMLLRFLDSDRFAGVTCLSHPGYYIFKVGNQPVNMHIDQTSVHYWF